LEINIMPRPNHNGTPAAAPRKRKLTALLVAKAKPQAVSYMTWDTLQRGLALRVEPSGYRAWKVVYRYNKRPRWYHLGAADAIALAQARVLAQEVMLAVARGKNPQAERKAARGAGTFEELAQRYVDDFAREHNKAWEATRYLVCRYLLPVWGKLPAAAITRADVKAMMVRVQSPSVANQTLAAASAIFSWCLREDIGGVTANPCSKITRNPSRSRERVLGATEAPAFWHALETVDAPVATALRLLLLTGQRPGEVCHMRHEHLRDGWWHMPGEPDKQAGWPGTKNGFAHRVWLPAPTRKLITPAETGYVLTAQRGGAVKNLDGCMRELCIQLGIERLTPHDLRRTHGSMITALGFGRDAMNRIQNHREGGIADVYDRHRYEAENKRVMEAVAEHIMGLISGAAAAKVISGRFYFSTVLP
jgi:integrase